jgi:hypothetical protein
MILTFTPAGIEDFFQETLQRTLDPTRNPAGAGVSEERLKGLEPSASQRER